MGFTGKLSILLGLWSTAFVQSVGAQESTEPDNREISRPGFAGMFDLNAKYLTGDWGGVRTALEDSGVKISLTYQQQGFFNFHGGTDTNDLSRFHGSYDLKLRFDTGKMGLWEGGYGYIKAKGNWREGIGFNRGKIGSWSKPNADEKEDDTIYINKWWVGQKFFDGLIDIRAGRIETKKDVFDKNAYADHEDKYFLNSWFVSSPNVPHTTAMGARLKITPNEWVYFLMGAFDGESRGSKRGGLRTTFHDAARFIAMWELGFNLDFPTAKGPLAGHYRIGMWYDGREKQIFRKSLNGVRRPRFTNDDMGMYLSFDQMLFKENDDPADSQGLGGFFRYGYAPEESNDMEHFWSLGMQYGGLIPERDKDVLAFGVAQGIYSDRFQREINRNGSHETVYEIYYAIQLTPWLVLTPDIQYIENPGGRGDSRDSIIGGFRLRITF